ncbi:MAG TPA: DUF4157 domain-containing protein [Pyrinomonadaceae bacterium]|nr:DUF4157 domain-containing protein [Pyrinomonadaceae bacterium]
MRLAEESQARLESFFRSYEGDERLRLPVIFVHAGFWADMLTRLLRIAAITIGRHVLVSRKVVEKNAPGRLTMPGWLLAHEAAHVRQFQRAGFVPFVYDYAREYVAFLVRGGKFDARARTEAYMRLAPEREAREVEAAYLRWRASSASQSLR